MASRHFSSQALVLIVISIAINMIGGQLASMVKLPIFLDSVGTLRQPLICDSQPHL